MSRVILTEEEYCIANLGNSGCLRYVEYLQTELDKHFESKKEEMAKTHTGKMYKKFLEGE